MTNPILPPNPCLLAIILITKTRDGTNNVFHYPPHPGHDRRHPNSCSLGTVLASAGSTSGSSTPDEPDLRHGMSGGDGLSANGGTFDESGSASPAKSGAGMWIPSSQSKSGSFLGLPDGFHHFLCPPETFSKQRFEMTIDDLVFLGWPVYAKGNGIWASKKSRKKWASTRARNTKPSDEETSADPRQEAAEFEDAAEVSSDQDGAIGSTQQDVPGFEAGYGHSERIDGPAREVLSMFHMAFILSPSPLEYQLRVDDMYKHIVKRFSKALRWEQARSNFVLIESEKLRSLKARHRTSEECIKQSSLANAMANLYEAISASRVAQINLTSRTSFSLQLPLPSSIPILPSLAEPQLPGLWLTTANSLTTADEDIDTSGTRLASHFTLLPLQEAGSIVAELTTAQSPLAPHIANYLRHSTPNRSFFQISQSSGIPLVEIQQLAFHLIYWRRARAIPPLHIRDIYIVSPNADMKKLKSAASQYTREFPSLPSLPKLLNMLSGGQRPFSQYVPSKDHKEAYLRILAWLMRGGWVTQLRTFAWIRVPPEMRQKARARLDEEDRERPRAKTKRVTIERRSRRRIGSPESEDEYGSQASDDAGEVDLPSGYLTPIQSSIYSTATVDSTSTARTAIPAQVERDDTRDSPQELEPVLIVDPRRSSGTESRYLAAIAEEVEERLGLEVRHTWEKCVKYFNGQHALEKISSREGLRRARVEALRGRWRDLGFLLEVRHW